MRNVISLVIGAFCFLYIPLYLNGESMESRINIITLGVSDITRSRLFYEKMGWIASSASNENIVIFHSKGTALALFPESMLAADAHTEPTKMIGFRGITLAYNVPSKPEVEKILDQAKAAGGKIIKEAQDVFWGGYSGYFADPDNHLWEVAWNPYWPLQSDGTIQIPE